MFDYIWHEGGWFSFTDCSHDTICNTYELIWLESVWFSLTDSPYDTLCSWFSFTDYSHNTICSTYMLISLTDSLYDTLCNTYVLIWHEGGGLLAHYRPSGDTLSTLVWLAITPSGRELHAATRRRALCGRGTLRRVVALNAHGQKTHTSQVRSERCIARRTRTIPHTTTRPAIL